MLGTQQRQPEQPKQPEPVVNVQPEPVQQNQEISALKAEISTLTGLVQQMTEQQEPKEENRDSSIPKPETNEDSSTENNEEEEEQPKTPEFPQPESKGRDRTNPRERFTELSRKNPREASKFFEQHSKEILTGRLFSEV